MNPQRYCKLFIAPSSPYRVAFETRISPSGSDKKTLLMQGLAEFQDLTAYENISVA